MRAGVIEVGVPVLFAVAGAVVIAAWVRGYVRAPLLPDRPLGHEHIHAMPAEASPPAGMPMASSLDPSTVPTSPSPAPVSPSPAASVIAHPAATAGGALSFYNASVAVPNMPGDWPGFRGPARDNVCATGPNLAAWGPSGPKPLWSVNLGEGYAGPAVHNGRVYVIDYDQGAQADALRCFSLADGTEIWRRSYPVVVKRSHGMSRTVPAVTDKYVVSLGPKCHVLCADAKTGEARWFLDLVRQFGTTVPEWYAGQCPLIDGNRVILAPGGSALMIAVDLATGKVLWQTANTPQWQMTHSSIMPMTIAGEKMYVYCASGGVVGVSAKDGRLLWQTPDWTVNTATVPSPVYLGDGKVFLTGGYEAGSMVLEVTKAGTGFAVKTVQRIDHRVFGSEQHTPILYKGYLYGIVSGGQLVCLDPGGRRLWESGPMHRFGLGPLVIAGGKIIAMSDKGRVKVAEANPAGFKLLAEAQLLEGEDAWGPLAIAGNRLLARDFTRMVCVEMGG